MRMKEINNIDFNNLPTGEELLYELNNNPIMGWREEAKRAYNEIINGSDELNLVSIVISNYIDYIHLTRGSQYAKAHRELANNNMMEEFNLAVNSFNLNG